MGFYYDMASCVGCRTCQIACKDKNNLEPGVIFRRVRSFETGDYPQPGYYHYSSACNHCENPKCVRTCPTKAMYIATDLTVQHDLSLCVRCRYCINNCPYGVPQFMEMSRHVGKCDACADLRHEGLNPVCVDACMLRCIEWGPLDELRARHCKEKPVSQIAILPSQDITTPSVLINPKPAAINTDFEEYEV